MYEQGLLVGVLMSGVILGVLLLYLVVVYSGRYKRLVRKGENEMSNFDTFIEDASRLTFEMYDDYTLEEMANRLSFKIFECRSMFRTLPKNTRLLYIIAYNETIHEIRRRHEE